VGSDAEITYCDIKLNEATGTDSTKVEEAGHRRSAEAEGN